MTAEEFYSVMNDKCTEQSRERREEYLDEASIRFIFYVGGYECHLEESEHEDDEDSLTMNLSQ